jgi:multiple antibiotic resistance protein
MTKLRQILREYGRPLSRRRPARSMATLAVGVCCLLGAGVAAAAEAAGSPELTMQFPLMHIFTFLFLMLGPFKIIGPFMKMTKGLDATLVRQIALRSTLFASLGLLFAAFLGDSILTKYGIPVPVLALSAGIILFLVALQTILQQFAPATHANDGVAAPAATTALSSALMPLAFPTLVTPYGIAALVVFLAVSPSLQGQLTIGAVVLAVMMLNLIAMLLTRHIPPVLGALLAILGAVLGVIQVALGLRIIHNSLRAMAVL